MKNPVNTALYYAKEAHKGQVRKFSGLPYYTHCEYVGNIASIYGRNDRERSLLQISGYLHDTVEDTETTILDLERVFGSIVGRTVAELTNVPKSFGNRKVRNEANHKRLVEADWMAQTIKCADILDNVPSMMAFDPNYGKIYIQTKYKLLLELARADFGLLKIARDTLESLMKTHNIEKLK